MKFKTQKKDFQNALTVTSKITPIRSTLQILNSILISASDNTICLRSSDLEMSVSTIYSGSVDEAGSVAVEGKFLLQFVSTSPFEEITIQSNEKHSLSVSTNAGNYDIGGQNPEEFPSAVSVHDSSTVKLSATLLAKIISNTAYIASKEDMKPALSGVLLRLSKGSITTVCTDGHRLVKYKVNDKSISSEFVGDVLIPAKFLHLIAEYLQQENEIVLRIGEKFISCKIGSTEFISRLIVERYPDFEAVIPTDNDKTFSATTKDLFSTVQRTALFANRNNHQIAFHLTNNHLSVVTNNSEMQRSAVEEMKIEYSGTEMKIGYNCIYLKEMLQRAKSKSLNFAFSTAIGATIITPLETEPGEDLIMLIMPIRLSD